jgi:hypothetical protein
MCVMPGERTVPYAQQGKDTWVLCRGHIEGNLAKKLFPGDDMVLRPLQLQWGGELQLYARLRQRKNGQGVVAKAKLTCLGIPGANPNKVLSLRYDWDEGKPSGNGWDDDLGDNFEHPWHHFHVNFDLSNEANELRMPLGPACMITFLRAFDYWYCKTFNPT